MLAFFAPDDKLDAGIPLGPLRCETGTEEVSHALGRPLHFRVREDEFLAPEDER